MAKKTLTNQLNLITLCFTIVALMVSIYAVSQRTNLFPEASEGATLYLTGNPQIAETGETVTVSLDVETKETPIQLARIVLTYPQTKLTFQKIDTSGSPFDMPLDNIHGSGYIQLGREASSPVVGRKHIATIYFKAKDTVSLTDIEPVKGTSLVDINNKNIYSNAVSREEAVSQNRSLFSVQFFFDFFTNLFR